MECFFHRVIDIEVCFRGDVTSSLHVKIVHYENLPEGSV